MQKIFKAAMLMTAVLVASSTFQANAQSNSDVVKNTAPTNASIVTKVSNGEMVTKDEMMTSHPELIKSFMKRYPSAQNQKWSKIDKGFWVSFTENGRNVRAGFDREGSINYSIVDCSIAQLPKQLQAQINSKYKAYQLIEAIQIDAYDQMIYQVVLEGRNNYVTLKQKGNFIEKVADVKKTN